MIMSPYNLLEMSPLESYNVLQKGGHYGRKGHYQDEFRRAKENKYNKSSYRQADDAEKGC
ncbi:MAG: hypothetical protein DDT31_00998 [Syntrophomonadaceae bacterium]|nr:hypothetical protein [Bacillota bacterium]